MDPFITTPVRPIEDCWHIYSNGTLRNSLFVSSADKVYCMNLLAILAYSCSLRVLCLVVEDTHFHCVVKGGTADILRFVDILTMLLRRRYASNNTDGEIVISLDPIRDDQELMRKIIYVMRNPIEAGYPYLPTEYPWGVGNLYFTDHGARRPEGTTIGSLTVREQRKRFNTQIRLPQDWLFNNSGMIVPSCYIDYDYVEKELFLTPKRFIAFMHVKKRDLVDLETDLKMKDLAKVNDETAAHMADDECRTIFGHGIKEASGSERILTAKNLWGARRVNSVGQLSRACMVPHRTLQDIFKVTKPI